MPNPDYPTDPDAATVIVLNSLTAKSKGEPYDEDLVTYATMFLAVGELVARGLDTELAMKVVDQALNHGDIHLSWHDGELNITIGGDW